MSKEKRLEIVIKDITFTLNECLGYFILNKIVIFKTNLLLNPCSSLSESYGSESFFKLATDPG